MEKERFFGVNWQSPDVTMPPEMNSGGAADDRLPPTFLNLGWEQLMHHNVQSGSSLGSLVSSLSSNPPTVNDSVVIHELFGQLGSVCDAGAFPPTSLYHSANVSCYSAPLSSPPKLNLSVTDHRQQGRGGVMPSNQMAAAQFAPSTSDPAKSYGLLRGQFGFPEAGKLSRVSSSQSLKAADGPQMGIPDDGKRVPVTDPESLEMEMRSKFGGRASGASTPDEMGLGNGQEASSALDAKINARKRKSKGKMPSFSSSNMNHPKSTEEDNSDAKRCRPAETNRAGKDAAAKPKTEQNCDAGHEQGTETNAKRAEPPKDYIHVRARRGQATDSHSLAERVRREKISERMKLLQDLVPGCNKITGKALKLDQIIGYVQSLQRQVEFLSTELATLNPQLDFLPKDQIYPVDMSSTAFSYAQQPLQSVATINPPMSSSLHRPPLDGFTDATSQLGHPWEDDLQYAVRMGFAQSQATAFSLQSSLAE
ncbi:hypothetical protein OPV22_028312 [Ensete ventricosum]|uniref:BHLH domain-containing protein n=1 Tax=Ensete ventricosum TaxID=4639 RepID=A0AAV8Q2D2_ENSVE|nr:hypothetical protein OPV22_028312 [Ensete ventricosum]